MSEQDELADRLREAQAVLLDTRADPAAKDAARTLIAAAAKAVTDKARSAAGNDN